MAYCYFNGGLVEETEVSLSVHTLGVNRGAGVFDFFRMRNGKYCFLEDHLTRFDRSQQFLNLSHTISKEEIKEALDMLRDWNGFADAGFKLVLLADGQENDSMLDPLFFITHTDLSNHVPAPYAGVILHEYVREYPHIKTINYLTSILLHKRRMAAGAIDVLYHHAGKVSEASRSNVFVVKDGQIITPDSNILEGITRKQILNLCKGEMEVLVQEVTLDDLHGADEVFLSSTLKEICPIVEIDGKPVGSGKVGATTRKISDMLHQLFQ